MDLGIEGRVALVTASSRGLGRASAEALAAEGVRVVVTARGAEGLDAAEQEIILPAAPKEKERSREEQDLQGPHSFNGKLQ